MASPGPLLARRVGALRCTERPAKSTQMELDQSIVKSIITWAESHPSILEGWFFGSRAIGAHGPSSDIDLAVLLKPDGEALALFIAKETEWEREMSGKLSLQVDLRPTQTDHTSYSELLAGAFKGARCLWRRAPAL